MIKLIMLKAWVVLFASLIFSAAWATQDQMTTTTKTTETTQTSNAPSSMHSMHANKANDSNITNQVKSNLNADKDINGLKIIVNTKNGRVTLTGVVLDKAQKQKAVQIAKAVQGVKEVKDRLNVKK